ncbi:MAG: hypothetical protein U1F35_20420 [Steroidobacteraceae bacterium]
MYAELSLKLKALTLAVMINALIMGGAAYLFDGQMHTDRSGSLVARTLHQGGGHFQASVFRP